MCGIAGYFLRQHGFNSQEMLGTMGDSIAHRGPDARATWQDNDIGLVHQRLSIIDLSEAGTQPMTIGDYTIVFNGEIYNYQSLKKSLQSQGIAFTTKTDTEVLLNLFIKEGAAALQKLNGMFAFAVWNARTKKLFIARDRLGKKPFYFYQFGTDFAFASEIKALLPLPFVPRIPRKDAIKDYFFYQYVPEPKTIFEHIYKLRPGHYAEVDLNNSTVVEQHNYWHFEFGGRSNISEKQACGELRELIDDATKLRMVSDVPLGAFLSGGVDSSAVVGMMAAHSKTPVNTCAIGFNDKKYDEVEHAQTVANHFTTNHHEFTVKEDVPSAFGKISSFFDEPFSDPSFIPTYFVAKLARQKVTVALAGDGGDESFAGYAKYNVDKTENDLRNKIPNFARKSLCRPLGKLAATIPSTPTKKASSLLSALARDPGEAFFTTNTFFNEQLWDWLITDDFETKIKDYRPAQITEDFYNSAPADDHLGKVLYTDLKTYLPGDILTKVDRMTMAVSLEARAPLLDYRVVEYAASLPSEFKLRGSDKKYILKKTLTKDLPREILKRKKMGFSVPLKSWLQSELSVHLTAAIAEFPQGIFNKSRLNELLEKARVGTTQHTYEAWSVICFFQWWKTYCHKVES